MLLQYAAGQIAFGIRSGALIGYAVQGWPLFCLRRDLCAYFAASRALPAKMIEAEIGGNAIDPRIKRALKTEPRQIYVGSQERFLIHVLTVLLGPSEMNGEAENRPVILMD